MGAGSEGEGEALGGGSSSDDGDGDEGKKLLNKLLEDGGELHKATTGHGADGDYERVLFYEVNGGGEEGYYTVIELNGWAREHARS
jgi:hypothetical protein